MKKLILIMLLILVGCTNGKAGTIYEHTRLVEAENGAGEKIGTVAISRIEENQVNQADLEDWYFNYVKPEEFLFAYLEYTDREYNGVYAGKGTVITNVKLTPEYDFTYSYEPTKDSVYYQEKDGKLVQQ